MARGGGGAGRVRHSRGCAARRLRRRARARTHRAARRSKHRWHGRATPHDRVPTWARAPVHTPMCEAPRWHGIGWCARLYLECALEKHEQLAERSALERRADRCDPILATRAPRLLNQIPWNAFLKFCARGYRQHLARSVQVHRCMVCIVCPARVRGARSDGVRGRARDGRAGLASTCTEKTLARADGLLGHRAERGDDACHGKRDCAECRGRNRKTVRVASRSVGLADLGRIDGHANCPPGGRGVAAMRPTRHDVRPAGAVRPRPCAA